eukprot:4262587-Amphidinium_carterae.2
MKQNASTLSSNNVDKLTTSIRHPSYIYYTNQLQTRITRLPTFMQTQLSEILHYYFTEKGWQNLELIQQIANGTTKVCNIETTTRK